MEKISEISESLGVGHSEACEVRSDLISGPDKQTQQASNSPHDLELPEQLLQTQPETPPCAPERPDRSRADPKEKPRAINVRRKDKNRLHSMRHGALSRYPLEALARLGENIRALRNFERALRNDLKPPGALGAFFFDRFWSSYLRCLLAARVDAAAFNRTYQHAEMPGHAAAIIDDELPTLITIDQTPVNEGVSPDLFRRIVLVEKYDRHFGREMYRALAMLHAMKSGDQAGIERCMRQALPSGIDRSEGSTDE